MGYFSSGTEGELYRQRYCERCRHDDQEGPYCAVWRAHMEGNYDQHKKGQQTLRDVLAELIPETESGGNGQCEMFLPREG